MHYVVKVFPKEGTTLDVLFDNGTIKRFDMSTLFENFPVFRLLSDRSLFIKAKPFYLCGITWTKNLDIDGQTIYEDGITITQNINVQKYLIGFQFRLIRERRRLSQQQVSDETGIDQGDLSKIELGTGNPTLKTLERLANYYGKTVKIQLK